MIVTGLAKAVLIGTTTEIQFILKLLSRHTKHMDIDSQVCFHRWLFLSLVKPWRCTTRHVESVNGINKDVSGDKLHPTTVLAYHVD